ncbi:MAG: DUF6273 domain-containing protein [Clostridiales bacterium]|nr:DUF6273 domain-containing protein [Clostridiales bacterium]
MEKQVKKGHPARSGKRWLALLMSLCLIGTMIPVTARAENSSPDTRLCEHHTEHTEDCGYEAPASGHECEHEHDDECGYAAGHTCEHVHTSECGYVESSEGSPCTFVCDICGNEAGTEGTNLSAAVMSISGFDFSSTGNNGATVKTINLDAAALRPESTWSTGGNLVYFGTYNSHPVAYRVLSAPSTQENSANYLLLDCDTILLKKAFDTDGVTNSEQTNPNEWTNSDLQSWLNKEVNSTYNFYGNTSVFSTPEKTAIANTTLLKQFTYAAGNYNIVRYEDVSSANHVFCLSAAEADGLYADNNTRIKSFCWWLRSADFRHGNRVGIVDSSGGIDDDDVDNDNVGVSPAFNVNLSSVLFASESGADKSSALAPVSDSTATEWKLTLLDSGKAVNVTSGQSVTRQDTTITVPYTYTDSNITNPVSQISVMITDKAYTESNAQVLYYGALQNVTISNTTDTGTFTLPADLADQICGTDYYAYIIAEDVNGEKETDYASAPVQITLPAASDSASVKGKGLGVSIIADPTAPATETDAWAGSFVYFGTYNNNPVKYRVLDRTTTDFGGTTMLLDCNSILWAGINSDNQRSRFDDDSNVWANSEIKTYLNGTFLTTGFTPLEQTAIATSTKESASRTDGNGKPNLNYAALRDDKIFLLDAKEATNTSYGYSNTYSTAANRKKPGGKDYWWLRSADSSDDRIAGLVPPGGYIYFTLVDFTLVGVSPALNVNLSSVIFSSVLSGTSGQPGAEYKLTLHDGNMTITPGTVTRDSGDEVTVPYTIGGTNAGNATRVSLMVLDKEYTAGNTNGAKLVAYEKLADAGSTTGTFTLTDDMKNGSYYYYIVAEDVNGDKATDYASAPVQITIPAVGGSNPGSGGGSDNPGSGDSDNPGSGGGSDNPGSGGSDNPGSGGSDHPNTPSNPGVTYQIINGAESSWTAGSSEGLTIRGNGDFDKFTGVKVDGSLLEHNNYTAKEGSTIITLKASYLNALAAGSHTVEIFWTDGSASTTFTKNANISDNGGNNDSSNNNSNSDNSASSSDKDKKDDVPKTGDRTPIVWLFILVVLSGTGLILTGKKGKKNLETLKK